MNDYRKIRILTTVLYFILVLLTAVLTITAVLYRSPMRPVNTTPISLSEIEFENAIYYYPPALLLSDEDIIGIVYSYFGAGYRIVYMNDDKLYGQADVLRRVIYINENIHGADLAETLAHEIIHIQYLTSNETHTAYLTFKILFESGVPELRDTAINIIYNQCQIQNRKGTEYDIGYYIKKYFNKEV